MATGRRAVLKPLVKNIEANSNIIGTDISQQMIEETKLELIKENLSCIPLLQMDAEELQFENNQFDFIFCGFGFFFFPSLEKAFAECLRVLKPGGMLAISTWGNRHPCHRVLKTKLQALGMYQSVTIQSLESEIHFIRLFKRPVFPLLTSILISSIISIQL